MERRRDVRYPAALTVSLRVRRTSKTLRGVAADVSKSGLLVEVSDMVDVGELVDIVMEVMQGRPLVTSGRVVHSLKDYRRLGIKFAEQSQQTQDAIEQLLQRLAELGG